MLVSRQTRLSRLDTYLFKPVFLTKFTTLHVSFLNYIMFACRYKMDSSRTCSTTDYLLLGIGHKYFYKYLLISLFCTDLNFFQKCMIAHHFSFLKITSTTIFFFIYSWILSLFKIGENSFSVFEVYVHSTL